MAATHGSMRPKKLVHDPGRGRSALDRVSCDPYRGRFLSRAVLDVPGVHFAYPGYHLRPYRVEKLGCQTLHLMLPIRRGVEHRLQTELTPRFQSLELLEQLIDREEFAVG